MSTGTARPPIRLASFVGAPMPDGIANLEAKFAATRADPESVAYLDAVRATPLVRRSARPASSRSSGRRPSFVYDDPAKTLDTTERTDVLLFPELVRKLGRPERRSTSSRRTSCPATDGTEQLGGAGQTRRDACASSPIRSRRPTTKSVHAGYAKRRQRSARRPASSSTRSSRPQRKQAANPASRFGSSSSSGLHAKTFAVDGQPHLRRLVQLRPALGAAQYRNGAGDRAVLRSRRALTRFFDVEVPMPAYEVRLAPDGNSLEWIERTASGEKRYDTEPDTSWSARMGVDLLSILPIEWLL